LLGLETFSLCFLKQAILQGFLGFASLLTCPEAGLISPVFVVCAKNEVEISE